MDEEIEFKQTSKINSGLLQVQRLDSLWKDAHKHSREGNYKAWNEDLDRVWCELGGDVPPKSDDEDTYGDFLKEYADIVVKKKARGFDSVSEEEKLALVKQKIILQKKELFLRRLMNTQGKGTAYDDSEDEEPE